VIERALRRLRLVPPLPPTQNQQPETWDTQLPMTGVDIGQGRALDLLRAVFPRYRSEYVKFPPESADASAFYLNNGYFEAVDAEVLYCMLRHFRPRTVIEVGSGFSTLITRQALDANGTESRLVAVDPEPRTSLLGVIDEHIASPVEEVDPDVFARLETNDVLFIDSSHEVRAGGDVNFLFFNVLPRLKPGVLVHVHDIFLPYEYPRRWILAGNTEQYLVLAFLAFNQAFEVVWPGHYMRMRHPSEVMAAFPSCTEATHPGSLWLRRRLSS
jgi:predicted O-methyltransferase YrrM